MIVIAAAVGGAVLVVAVLAAVCWRCKRGKVAKSKVLVAPDRQLYSHDAADFVQQQQQQHRYESVNTSGSVIPASTSFQPFEAQNPLHNSVGSKDELAHVTYGAPKQPSQLVLETYASDQTLKKHARSSVQTVLDLQPTDVDALSRPMSNTAWAQLSVKKPAFQAAHEVFYEDVPDSHDDGAFKPPISGARSDGASIRSPSATSHATAPGLPQSAQPILNIYEIPGDGDQDSDMMQPARHGSRPMAEYVNIASNAEVSVVDLDTYQNVSSPAPSPSKAAPPMFTDLFTYANASSVVATSSMVYENDFGFAGTQTDNQEHSGAVPSWRV